MFPPKTETKQVETSTLSQAERPNYPSRGGGGSQPGGVASRQGGGFVHNDTHTQLYKAARFVTCNFGG